MNLKTYIKQHTTVTEFADRIGRSRQQVHRYIAGQNVSKDVIEDVKRATDGAVGPSDWFEAESEKASAA
jgi:plasmid maintenance system antidote protein VapI